MNSAAIYRWLQLPLWLRLFTFALIVCALMLLVWMLWQAPLRQRSLMQAQQQRLYQHYQTALRSFQRTPSLSSTETAVAALQLALRPAEPQTLSLLNLTAGKQLEGWQPTADGGELTLTLAWPQLEELLHYLSELHAGVELPQFTLKRVGQQLNLQLSLVLNHEG